MKSRIIGLGLLIVGFGAGLSVRPAASQTASTAECTFTSQWGTAKGVREIQDWMNAQVGQGRVRFESYGSGAMCAW
jgi:hypothetical protein